jgi:hypothetical protein
MSNLGPNEINNREHIAPDTTGDNIAAKKTANYVWNSSANQWQRMTQAGSGGGGGVVQIQDSSGNALNSTSGSLDVAITSGGLSTTAAQNNLGTATSLANAATATIVNITSSAAGYQINGFVAHGTGDGYWFVQVAGSTILSGRTRWSQPTCIIALPNPVTVTTASAVTLQVTNESGSTANYEGTLLGS